MSLQVMEQFSNIRNFVILAPKSLLSGWVREMSKHMDQVPFHCIWDSQRSRTDKDRMKLSDLVRRGGVLLVNVESFGRKNEYLMQYLRPMLQEETMVILDESSKVKDQAAHRTKYISNTFEKAEYKLALTGTLSANSPLDVYGQFLFLQPDFWKARGFRTWHLFKGFFAVLQDIYVQGGRTVKNGRVVGYRKLEQLASIIRPYITTIVKDEVLDLPEKVFERISIELNDEEASAYSDLKRQMMTILTSGELVAIDQKISLYQKFRQLCGGWIEPSLPVTKTPSKLAALLDLVSDNKESAVIFAVYTHEIVQICEALGDLAGRYDGSVSINDRQQNVDDFNDGKLRFLVVQPMAGAYGLNLQANCNTIIYYSRPNSPEVFQQSQDRIHRIGQTSTCFYIDLVAEGRIDEKIIEALEAKEDLSKLFAGISARNLDDFI